MVCIIRIANPLLLRTLLIYCVDPEYLAFCESLTQPPSKEDFEKGSSGAGLETDIEFLLSKKENQPKTTPLLDALKRERGKKVAKKLKSRSKETPNSTPGRILNSKSGKKSGPARVAKSEPGGVAKELSSASSNHVSIGGAGQSSLSTSNNAELNSSKKKQKPRKRNSSNSNQSNAAVSVAEQRSGGGGSKGTSRSSSNANPNSSSNAGNSNSAPSSANDTLNAKKPVKRFTLVKKKDQAE